MLVAIPLSFFPPGPSMSLDLTSPARTFLHDSPFYILGATTRDNQARIAELAEERALLIDPDLCQKARADLANPRARVAAEIAWLPGVSPRRALSTLAGLDAAEADLSELPPLARANAMAARAPFTPRQSDAVLKTLSDLARAVADIDPETIARELNEDRSIAGIPLIRDEEIVRSEFAARRRHYRDVSTGLLDALPTDRLVHVVTELAATQTQGGASHATALIEDIVSSYEVAAQPFLQGQAEGIDLSVAHVREAGRTGSGLDAALADLRARLKTWTGVTQPLQLVCRSKGLDHPASRRVAIEARDAAIDLWNVHKRAEASASLLGWLKDEFRLLSEFRERISEDATALDDIVVARAEAKRKRETFDESLAFSAEVGVVFKERLTISEAGLSWKGQTLKLEDISRLRWGGTRHSVNGIPTGTTYEIHAGGRTGYIVINLRNEQTSSATIERLWKGVGFRIMCDWAERLKAGGQLAFPDLVVQDRQVTLTRTRLFRSDETKSLTWDKVTVYNASGSFVIAERGNTGLSAVLSYTQVDNVHVLEAMIRAFMKNKQPHLSSILD